MSSTGEPALAAARVGTVCLYCLEDSRNAESEDHPVPEAMGGRVTLPKGYVCDDCNQYLGAKVDEPFLRYYPIAERVVFGQVRGKRGRIRRLLTDQFMLDVSPSSIHMTTVGPVRIRRSADEDAWLLEGSSRRIDMRIISRGLYRIALGCFAISDPRKAFDPRLDPIRAYIRRPPFGYAAKPFLEAGLVKGATLQQMPDLMQSRSYEVGFCETSGATLCMLDFVNVAFMVPLEWNTPDLPRFQDVRLRIAWEDGTVLDDWTLHPQEGQV